MYIEDLFKFPTGHPPSPYNFPIQVQEGSKWGEGILQDGLSLTAIGWLGDSIPRRGATSPKCISQLWEAYKSRLQISDGSNGWHNCELCQGEDEWYPDGEVGPITEWQGHQLRIYGHGHFLIHHNEIVCLSPALILHYILGHEYRPPDVFIEAVEQGRFLSLNDLIWTENTI